MQSIKHLLILDLPLLIFLLLLLILGNSDFKLLLMGLFSIWQLTSWWVFKKELVQVPKYVLLLLGGWWFFLLAGFLTSTSLPLSLDALITYMIAWSLGTWSLFLPKKLLSTSLALYYGIIVTFVVVSLSILIQVLPTLAKLLPGMNLLYPTYGHNHLAALLLLTIPLAWWFWVNKPAEVGENRHFSLFLLSIFYLSLFTSFGRVAILIGFLQLFAVLACIPAGSFGSNLSRKIHAFIPKMIMATFIVIALFQVASSFLFSASHLPCPLPEAKRLICKSFSLEKRPYYWGQALKIIMANPLTGTGPGTFSIAAKKYQTESDSSNYAHNSYLQMMADIGIVGGVFYGLLMASLLFLVWNIALKKKRLHLAKSNSN